MSHHTSTAEIHCKNVPHRIDKKKWFKFVNQHVKNKSWLKHYKNNKEWVIVVKSHEKNDWKNALTNKYIEQTRITVYIKDPSNRGRYGHRQSAFGGHGNDKHFRTAKGNNKYSKCFTKHLTKKQQDDMLSLCGKRYNADNKMLNLSQIINTEQEHWASFSNQSFVQHLLGIIKANCNDVKSIDFSNNNIITLEPFKKIMEYAPYLENLSILDNPIKSLSEINYLNGLGNNLRELHLRNLKLLNEVCGIKQLYVFELLRVFPNLRLLDGESLQQHCLVSFGSTLDDLSVSFNQKAIAMPVSSHSLCTEQSQITEFISNYYQIFDNERRKLIKLYHCDAIFTLTYTPNLDTPTPNENRSKDFKIVGDSCNRINRNLIDNRFKYQARFKQMNKVRHGNLDICKYLSDEFMKRTKHQISYMAIDCHPVKVNDKQFMNVSINGYYAENQSVARKFNRTWLLMQEMNAIQIVNDQLHLGGVIPQTKLLEHAPASSIADLNKQNKKQIHSAQNAIQNGGSGNVSVQMSANSQQDLIQKVANHCGCPNDFARQALEASNWDAQAAVANIEKWKSQQTQQN